MKAVVFVDVQNDFVTGALRNEDAIKAMPKIVEFAKECVKNGYRLYATRDTHEKTVYGIGKYQGEDMSTEPQAGYMLTLEGKRLPVEHCVEGTDGWQIVTELMDELVGKCTFVDKPTFGSFDLAEIMDEDLAAWDDKNYFDEIVICGFCTAICVAANAVLLRAKFPNTKITVMKDLCACVTPESHAAALKTLMMQQIDVM